MGSFDNLLEAYYSPESIAMKKEAWNSFMLAIVFGFLAFMSCACLGFLSLLSIIIVKMTGFWVFLFLCLLLLCLAGALTLSSFLLVVRGVYLNMRIIKHVDDEMLRKGAESDLEGNIPENKTEEISKPK